MKGVNLHMNQFNEVLTLAFQMNVEEVVSRIEKAYFEDNVFDERYYGDADSFVFRMDVTELSYGKLFRLTYDALMAQDFSQYLMGLKVILVKLKDLQRLSYYDRPQMLALLNEMNGDSLCQNLSKPEETIPDITWQPTRFLASIGSLAGCQNDHEVSKKHYHQHQTLNEATLEKEFKTAVQQGVIYHHIVATDHMLLRQKEASNPLVWLHLAKLLAIHYATEKAPWNRDLTDAFLEALEGLGGCGEELPSQQFHQLISGIINIWIKRQKADNQSMNHLEKAEFLNFLINAYEISNEEKLLLYITKLAETISQADASHMEGIHCWIAAQPMAAEERPSPKPIS